MGYNTTLLYTDPLHIVEGKGCKLYSAEGREYLDCANNVAHVGHSHPKVTICHSASISPLKQGVKPIARRSMKP